MMSFTMQGMAQVCPPGDGSDITRRGDPYPTVTWRPTAASERAHSRSAFSGSSA